MSDQELYKRADQIENALDGVFDVLKKHLPYYPKETHFCRNDVQERFGLDEVEGQKTIEQWLNEEIIRKVGVYRNWNYYEYVG